MNVLQKSSISVAIATMVTSVLILSTGVSVAENKLGVVLINNATVPTVERVDATAEILIADSDAPPPPPGLFLEGGKSLDSSKNTMMAKEKNLTTPALPNAPIKPSVQIKQHLAPVSASINVPALVAPNQPQFNSKAPSLEMPASSMQPPKMADFTAKQPILNKPQVVAKIQMNRPNAPKQLEMHPSMRKMQQHFSQMHKAPVNRPQQFQQAPNFQTSTAPVMTNNEQGRGNSSQRYMFIPAPYIQGYRYYQMPGYGAYYYQPSPQMMPRFNANTQTVAPVEGNK